MRWLEVKTQNAVIGKESVTQIFVGKEEAEREDIIAEIQELRNRKNKVVVFVGGQNELITSLKAMLQLVAVEC